MRNILFFDFDGTIANSFADAPNGRNIANVHSIAVQTLFGDEGTKLYEAQGGLNNRDPKELIADLCNELTDGRDRQYLVKRLAEIKSALYEIDGRWPKMFHDAKEFFKAVEAGDIPIEVCIVSSGFTKFIEKTFKVNGLESPRMITSDEVQNVNHRAPYKPYTYQFAIAHRQFLPKGFELHSNYNDFVHLDENRPAFKAHVAYIGDDPVKDGGLAENARIPYLYVPFTKPGYTPDASKGQVGIRDYAHLFTLLKTQKEALLAGVSWSEILLHRRDCEVFPPLRENWLTVPHEGSISAAKERL